MNLSSPKHLPIEHREAAKPVPREPERETPRDPSPPRALPLRANGRGNEPERPRESAPRDSGKTRPGDTERIYDSLFFQQLLAPFGSPGEQGQGGSRGQAFAGHADGAGTTGVAGWNQLVDDLTVRLPAGTGQSLQATLFMPNLGRVGLNARNRSPRGWDIDLDCAQAHAAEQLREQHARCQDDLSRALCQPVNLSVRHAGCA